MSREVLISILNKELDYQRTIFGDYKDDPNMNVASLIIIIEEYLEKAKKSFISKWEQELPDWLNYCKEQGDTNLSPWPAPVKTYEELIKVFALAGATLEAFTQLNPEHWRENGIKEKWNKEDKTLYNFHGKKEDDSLIKNKKE